MLYVDRLAQSIEEMLQRPLRVLRGLSLFQVLIAVQTWLYALRPEAEGNRLLLALAFLMTFLAAGMLAAALWLEPNRLNALQQRIGRRWLLIMICGLVIAFGFGFAIRPEWIYAQIALMLALIIITGYRLLGSPSAESAPPALFGWLAIVAAVVVISLRISALGANPQIQITDEGWHLGWVMHYLRTGTFSDGLMFFGGHDVQRYYWPMALWLQWVGVGLWEARLFSYFVLLLTTAVTAAAAATLYGRAAGWVSAAIMLSSAVVVIGMRIRHDAGLALAVALCLWFYAQAVRSERLYLHALAGLALGLGWFAHYHAIGFGGAFALGLYLPLMVAAFRKQGLHFPRSFVLFMVGGLLGAAVVFVIQVLPDFQAFIDTRQPRTPASLAAIVQVVIAHLGSIAFHSQLEFLLIAAATVTAFFRRAAVETALALTLLLSHLALGVMADVAWDHYPVALTPLYAVLVTSLILHFIHSPARHPFVNVRAAVITLALLLPLLGWSLRPALTYALEGHSLRPPPPPAAQWVLDHVPVDKRLEGEHYYFLWLWQYDYVSPLTSNMMPDRLKETMPTLEDVWSAVNPDVLIFDPNLNTCCILQPLADSGFLAAQGYVIAAQIPGANAPITIYARPGSWED